jgi:hypothetical protein
VQVVSEHFVPVKIHVKEQPAVFERFKAQWTPTQLILDGDGIEHHRIEGFLPKEDFIAELELGLGKLAFEEEALRGRRQHVPRRVRRARRRGALRPRRVTGPACRTTKGGNHESLKEDRADSSRSATATAPWARKASVWTT